MPGTTFVVCVPAVLLASLVLPWSSNPSLLPCSLLYFFFLSLEALMVCMPSCWKPLCFLGVVARISRSLSLSHAILVRALSLIYGCNARADAVWHAAAHLMMSIGRAIDAKENSCGAAHFPSDRGGGLLFDCIPELGGKHRAARPLNACSTTRQSRAAAVAAAAADAAVGDDAAADAAATAFEGTTLHTRPSERRRPRKNRTRALTTNTLALSPYPWYFPPELSSPRLRGPCSRG